jgi:RNA polymerase sigma-70 factor (ECF subfamily)
MPVPGDGLDPRLAAARAGSVQALGEVLQAQRNYLLAIAAEEVAAGLKAKAGASDLVQETFLEAQRDFARFHGDSDAELRAWLRRLLLNNVANFTRRYRADKRQAARERSLDADGAASTPGGQLAAESSSPSARAAAHEQAEALQRALERLPEDYRRVLRWRYEEQRSFEDIAQQLACTPNAARKLWARAIHRLEQDLGNNP